MGDPTSNANQSLRFLHCADLHIDSPLRGLEAYEGAPVERLRSATRESFENLITLAVRERVAFVVIAGDLFDGKWQDIQTGLWTAAQFRRLEREEIPVYLLRGNHDAASEVRQRVRWPDNVREFSVEQPETIIDAKTGFALHGQGFTTREVLEDLAANYPDPVPDTLNIGVLHTSLTGDPNHDSYAATTEDVLKLRGYDYWALGHVHNRRTVHDDPTIIFPGNTQGRHIHERGAKGCVLVSVSDGHISRVDFEATDTLRWHQAIVEMVLDDQIEQLYVSVSNKLHQCREESDGRFAAVRLWIRGACRCHSDLMTQSIREEVVTEIRNMANSISDVWVEKIKFDTSAPVDVEALRSGNDLMGDLLALIDEFAAGDNEQLLELSEHLKPLQDKAQGDLLQAGIDLSDPETIRRWLGDSERLLVGMIRDE
ncbi:MAG: DNA repair exonuclease [Planctomycetaceae bacterium]|nr:DNA repair exonuclease [Planctomycetaceae bacterium]